MLRIEVTKPTEPHLMGECEVEFTGTAADALVALCIATTTIIEKFDNKNQVFILNKLLDGTFANAVSEVLKK